MVERCSAFSPRRGLHSARKPFVNDSHLRHKEPAGTQTVRNRDTFLNNSKTKQAPPRAPHLLSPCGCSRRPALVPPTRRVRRVVRRTASQSCCHSPCSSQSSSSSRHLTSTRRATSSPHPHPNPHPNANPNPNHFLLVPSHSTLLSPFLIPLPIPRSAGSLSMAG